MRPRTTHFYNRLAFETLEARELLSGVTALLDHGLLTVTGASDSSTEIHVWRQANRVLVDGVAGSFAVAQVQSIRVACGPSGDQTVDLGIGKASGQTALARPVTVDSGSGNETVQLGATSVYFAETGHQLAVTAKGTVRLDGAKLDWFDTHLQDAGIRWLAKTEYSDHVLGRADMLAIFGEVEQQGTVTAVALGDLQAMAGYSALYSGVAYVQNLLAKVALGNPANAHYQGEPLDNLAAGDSADHLEKLVDKWFLGLDHPDSTVDNETYVYAEAKASLFPYAPVYTDVRQGYVGDCYLMGGLAEIAMHDRSAIRNMFIVNGDGTYTVRFYNGRQADYVTVDSDVPADQGKYVFANQGQLLTDTTIALWAPLAEKAYAEINEEGWLRTNGSNSYASLDMGCPNDVYTEVTGLAAVGNLNLNKPANFTQFVNAYRAGDLQWFISNDAPPSPLIGKTHVYAVVSYDASTRSVLVYNPWGIANGSKAAGLVWISWADVKTNFSCWCRSK